MGAENAIIAVSEEVTKEEFIEFFEALDCHWRTGHKDEAVLNDEHTQVGICLMNVQYIDMFDEEDINDFSNKLGSRPVRFFEVNRNKREDPNHLYLRVALKMSLKWNLVIQDIKENILTVDGIEKVLS